MEIKLVDSQIELTKITVNDEIKPAVKERERWIGNSTYVLTMMGFVIGLGALWRFPYLCYRWGGVLFLIPYLSALVFLGIPMALLEVLLG
jgi:SNF family Na+-dependent transporter